MASLTQSLLITNVSTKLITVGMYSILPGRTLLLTKEDEIDQHTRPGRNGEPSTVEKYKTASLITYSLTQSGIAQLSASLVTPSNVAAALTSFQIPANSVVRIEGVVTARRVADSLIASTWRYTASFGAAGVTVRQLGADGITPTQQDGGASATVLASGSPSGQTVPLNVTGLSGVPYIWSFSGVMYIG